MKPCQVDWQKLVIQEKIYSVNEKSSCFKKYIVYTDASDDVGRVQLSQENDGTEFPVAFLSHTFIETQRKWSTTEQEACGVYYMITKLNYCLQGTNITVK